MHPIDRRIDRLAQRQERLDRDLKDMEREVAEREGRDREDEEPMDGGEGVREPKPKRPRVPEDGVALEEPVAVHA